MTDIIVGEKVINLNGKIGTIISFDGSAFCVDFGTRSARFMTDAFEKGYLKYENLQLHNQIMEKAKEERESEKLNAFEKQKQRLLKSIVDEPVCCVDKAVVTYFRTGPFSGNGIRYLSKGTQEKIKDIFRKCDSDLESMYEAFEPKMRYENITSKARSKYAVCFLTKYFDTYVLRVFWRNDIYKKGVRNGLSLLRSDISEVIRIFGVDGEPYCYTRNINNTAGHYTLSTKYCAWEKTDMRGGILIDEVIRKCDCKYLNDIVEEKNINIYLYAKLVIPALYSNKAEIVFKNKLYLSTYYIDDLAKYLEGYSSKQIDFASRNKVINALPAIKDSGVYDLDILRKLEAIMKSNQFHFSLFTKLNDAFVKHRFDKKLLIKKLIAFLKNNNDLNIGVYSDYIREVSRFPTISVDDLFDRDYEAKLEMLLEDRQAEYSRQDANDYAAIARGLSWIDREENGLFIIIPKTIEDFRYEGYQQHNCVFKCWYFEKVISRASIIVFLRKEKNEPYVTIEFDFETFEVRQALGKYNSVLDIELYDYIVALGERLRNEVSSR